MEYSTEGQHIIADLHQIKNFIYLNNKSLLLRLMRDSIKESGATLIKLNYHLFKPSGITTLAVLAESHQSCHTYPNERFASVDCYTCGNSFSPQKSIDFIIKTLKPIRYNTVILSRGDLIKGIDIKTRSGLN